MQTPAQSEGAGHRQRAVYPLDRVGLARANVSAQPGPLNTN